MTADLQPVLTPSGKYGILCPVCSDVIFGPRRWHGGRLLGSRKDGGGIEGQEIIDATLARFAEHQEEEHGAPDSSL